MVHGHLALCLDLKLLPKRDGGNCRGKKDVNGRRDNSRQCPSPVPHHLPPVVCVVRRPAPEVIRNALAERSGEADEHGIQNLLLGLGVHVQRSSGGSLHLVSLLGRGPAILCVSHFEPRVPRARGGHLRSCLRSCLAVSPVSSRNFAVCWKSRHSSPKNQLNLQELSFGFGLNTKDRGKASSRGEGREKGPASGNREFRGLRGHMQASRRATGGPASGNPST